MKSEDFVGTPDQFRWLYNVFSSQSIDYTGNLSVQVNGGTPVHRQFNGSTVMHPGGTYASDDHYWTIDPCAVPGGSDLPGTTVVVSDETSSSLGQSSGTASAVLDPDTLAPVLTVTSDPPAGTKVNAGDIITFTQVMTEEARGGALRPWQTGVKQISILGASGQGDVVTPATFGDTALPCDQKSWQQKATFTYTVPADPPSIVRLFPYTLDFAGNVGSLELDYPTAETWEGTMSLAGFTKIDTSSSETVCTQPPVDFTISFTSAPDGTVHGKGRYHGPPYTCVNSLFGSVASAPQRGTFTIVGQRTGDRFSLGITAPFSGDVGALGGFWPNNPNLQWDVSIQGAEAQTVITGQGGGTNPGRVTLTVDLTCSGCTTGSS